MGQVEAQGTLSMRRSLLKRNFITSAPFEKAYASNLLLKASVEATLTTSAGNRFHVNGIRVEKALIRSPVRALG